jgi:hypothetical protein
VPLVRCVGSFDEKALGEFIERVVGGRYRRMARLDELPSLA